MKPVNVLLIVVDALRADHLPVGGYARETTPRLGNFFPLCTTFSRCFSPVGWTLPACASIVTGQMPDAHGLVDHNCRFKLPKLGHYLGDAFHRVAITNNGNLVPDYIPEASLESLGFAGRPAKWKNFGWEDGFDQYLWTHREDHLRPYELATHFFKTQQTSLNGKPWLMFFHTNIVHDYHMDRGYYRQARDFLGHELHPELIAFRDGPEIWRNLPQGLDLGEAKRQIVAKYDAGIRFADDKIASLLEHVDLSSTVVIFTSDHGEGFEPERGRVHHCGRLHNDLLHVPLVVWLPEHLQRRHRDRAEIAEVSSTLDIVPTILRLLDFPPAPVEGEFLFNLPQRRILEGSDRGYLYWEEDCIRESYDTCQIELRSTLEYPFKRIVSRRNDAVVVTNYNLANDRYEHASFCYAEVDAADAFEAITFVVAVSDEAELKENLLASPVASSSKHEWLLVNNAGNCRYDSISALYQDCLERASNDLVFFLHQDVFLPADWERQMFASLKQLETLDPQWGVLGAAGAQQALPGCAKELLGHWSDVSAYWRLGSLPAEVQTLDELWLGLRKSRGVGFDRLLPGFHCYGTDVCLSASELGLGSYAIDAFVWHKYREADGSFVPRMESHPKIQRRWTPEFMEHFLPCAEYIERKWQKYFPIHSTCWTWGMASMTGLVNEGTEAAEVFRKSGNAHGMDCVLKERSNVV